MTDYFERLLETINASVRSFDYDKFVCFVKECAETLKFGRKIIASGLGKNVPICEKFVGTMLSLGMDAAFLHTNSAVHGDLGTVHKGDLVIILSKSGETQESICLAEHLIGKHANIWLITFADDSRLQKMLKKVFVIHMDHEGDMWDIVPNNSTTLNLIVLQALAICTAESLGVTLEEFRRNHPGGAIGEQLKCSNSYQDDL